MRQAVLLEATNGHCEEARDLLLPRLMSGELDVADLDIAMPEPPSRDSRDVTPRTIWSSSQQSGCSSRSAGTTSTRSARRLGLTAR